MFSFVILKNLLSLRLPQFPHLFQGDNNNNKHWDVEKSMWKHLDQHGHINKSKAEV